MAFPREILNEIKWREGMSLEKARVTYIHRGAPGDLMIIDGSEIRELGRSFFVTGDASIPYHRIVKIEYDGRILYELK